MIKNELLIMDEHTLLNNKMCKILRDITGEEFEEVISQEEVDAIFKGRVNAEVCSALDNVRKKIDKRVSADKSLKETIESTPEIKQLLKSVYKAIDDEKNAHLDTKYYCVTDRIFVHFHRIGAQHINPGSVFSVCQNGKPQIIDLYKNDGYGLVHSVPKSPLVYEAILEELSSKAKEIDEAVFKAMIHGKEPGEDMER